MLEGLLCGILRSRNRNAKVCRFEQVDEGGGCWPELEVIGLVQLCTSNRPDEHTSLQSATRVSTDPGSIAPRLIPVFALL